MTKTPINITARPSSVGASWGFISWDLEGDDTFHYHVNVDLFSDGRPRIHNDVICKNRKVKIDGWRVRANATTHLSTHSAGNKPVIEAVLKAVRDGDLFAKAEAAMVQKEIDDEAARRRAVADKMRYALASMQDDCPMMAECAACSDAHLFQLAVAFKAREVGQ